MKKIISAIFLVALVGATFFIINRNQYREAEGKIFGTSYHIKYSSTHDLSADILATLNDVDNALSMFNQESTLSRFNRNEDYEADTMFREVITLAQQVSQETDGAFDITVAPLVNLWGFGFKNRENVLDSQVDSIREFVGYNLLEINKKYRPNSPKSSTASATTKTANPASQFLLKKDARVTIDCGAIAKGYGVQQVGKMLSQKGCTNYMVEIGGEVVVKGSNQKGKPWTLGINKPVDDSTNVNNEIEQIIHITDKAVATSGNYRNFYYQGSRKVAHTINPATGYPVEHSLLSATVFHSSCAMADAYATSFMVMGLEAAQAFVESHDGLEAFLIYADADGQYKTWQSKGFKTFLKQ